VSTMEKSIHVDVPIQQAYNQWTQFETFPQFMEGVDVVKQVDDTHLHWKAEIAGVTREWDAEIVDQTPDERITWRSLAGTKNDGTVSFAPDSGDGTRVTLRLEYEPEGIAEKSGDLLNIVERRAQGDLERFKDFIESRGTETGAWRGDVGPNDQS
jgi:uncharacterized membrane protein